MYIIRKIFKFKILRSVDDIKIRGRKRDYINSALINPTVEPGKVSFDLFSVKMYTCLFLQGEKFLRIGQNNSSIVKSLSGNHKSLSTLKVDYITFFMILRWSVWTVKA